MLATAALDWMPLGAVVLGLVGFIWRDRVNRVDQDQGKNVSRELCNERHENLEQGIKRIEANTARIDTKLAELCNGGRLGKLEKQLVAHDVRLDKLDGK